MGKIKDDGALLGFHSPAHAAVAGTLVAMWKDLTPQQLQSLEKCLADITGFEPFVSICDLHPELCKK